MRRKISIIAVIVILVLMMTMLVACGDSKEKADDITNIVSESLSGVGESIYNEIAYIHDNFSNRTYGTSEELAFANYVTSKLDSYGYSNKNKEFNYDNPLNLQNGEKLTSTNVIFKKENNNTDKAVLITSHLDNMYNYEEYQNEGIYDGVTGVAIMLALADSMKDMDLPYDVYFVGFGASAPNMLGVSVFINDFYTFNKKSDTLLAIDLSRPIGGDHMYMYTDEVKTKHAEYLYSIANNAGFDYRPIPKDKKPMQAMVVENQPMNYSHVGVLSPNIYFITERIPTVNFLSVNWEANVIGDVIERKGSGNIANTKKDNFDYFVELVGKDRIVSESDMVYTTIMKAVTNDAFVATMEESIATMKSYSIWSSNGLIMGLRIGLAVVLIVVAMLVASKLKNELPSRSVEEFMADMGMGNNGNAYGNSPFNSKMDPFGDDQNNTNNSNNSGDPFDQNESNDDKNTTKKDDGDDIFGI